MRNNRNKFLEEQKVVIIGAGLVGTLGAILLAQRGARVEIIERQSLATVKAFSNRRSFNVTISSRGKAALEAAGIWKRVEAQTIPITGRMCHMGVMATAFPYSPDCELVLHGARRSDVNSELLDAALEAGVNIRFGWTVSDLDKSSGAITISPVSGDGESEIIDDASFVIGADGVNSVVRSLIHRNERTNYMQRFLDWNYREIHIPAGSDPNHLWQMDPGSLHIWPRGDLMMFALPNPDGSFTGNFIYPVERDADFSKPGKIDTLLRQEFPDVVTLVTDAEEKLRATSPSYFQTQRNSKWFHQDKFVLVGDAAHATVPFYGQGMNSGFESMVELLDWLERYGPNERAKAFAAYQQSRKPHTDAVADLSIANFDELRSNFAHLLPQARRRLDVLLYRLFPRLYIPLHVKISHSTTGYQTAIDECAQRDRILKYFGFDILVYAFAAFQALINGFEAIADKTVQLWGRLAVKAKRRLSVFNATRNGSVNIPPSAEPER